MQEMMVTTFPSEGEFQIAVRALGERGLPFEVLPPAQELAWLAAPGLILSPEVRSTLLGRVGDSIRFSGWIDYRPPGPWVGVEPELCGDVDLFGQGAITMLTQCVADEEKIRLIAELSGNLEPVFPYLNAIMPQASYSPRAQTFSYLDGHRMVVLSPQRIAMAKADDLWDAWLRLDLIRRRTSAVWARRDEIEPDYTTRKKPPALEILKRLPGTNCGRCGEMTCMAFALRVWVSEAKLESCEPILEPERAAHLAALREICAGMVGGAEPAYESDSPRSAS